MKVLLRYQRILILSLLSVSVFVPIVLVTHRLNTFSSIGRKGFTEDLSSTRFRNDLTLNAIEQESGEGFRKPKLVFQDRDFNSIVRDSSSNKNQDYDGSKNAEDTTNPLDRMGNNLTGRENQHFQERESSLPRISKDMDRPNQTMGELGQNLHSQLKSVRDEEIKQIKSKQSNQTTVRLDLNTHSQLHRPKDEKVKQIGDQLVRARLYLSFTPPGSNSHLVKELKLQIKELEHAVGEATKDSDLSRRTFEKMRHMESSLLKAGRAFPDCSAMTERLRAMTNNAEEQVRAQTNQVSYLVQLASRTTPKGLHCLSMWLTADYFALSPQDRQLPNQQKLHDQELYHYAVFSDNVLACAVVVNSTVSSATEPEKVVFHVVTDSLNLPAISMWFLLNHPGNATIQIQSMNKFEWLSKDYKTMRKNQNSTDPRFTSELNYLRFYLPSIFPSLDKIVLLDHDVVVQKDLSGLWSFDMNGKVNGAVNTCQASEVSFRSMEMFIDFSDPSIAKKIDVNSCTWGFGMNLFDLSKWRKHNLTNVYHEFLQLGNARPVFRPGTLPLGWITFYNQTASLDRNWHILGLGHNSKVEQEDIERAAVIHYDGVRKPWLDIGFGRYKDYWNRYVNYDHTYLQQCNIHG